MSANVKLGSDVLEGVNTVELENADAPGEYVAFTLGSEKPEQTKTEALSMASGDQVITPDAGKVLTQVTVTKPATLTAGNIKSGVNIGGVAGSYSGPETQTKTEALSMSAGDQVVTPDSGKVLTSVTITKPSTLAANNIRKDVNIGGVVGTLDPGASIPGGATVTFFDDNDDTWAINMVPNGGTVKAPVDPTKTDYVFIGWSTTKGQPSTMVNFPRVLTNDLSVYAEFTDDLSNLDQMPWSVIRAQSDAGTASSLWSVGQCKGITIPSGTTIGALTFSADTTYYAFILGFDHNLSVEASGYSHSITFGTFKTAATSGKDIALTDSKYNSTVSSGTWFSMNNSSSNAGGWKNSRMRNVLLGSTDTANSDASADTPLNPTSGTFMAALPEDLRTVLKPIIKYTDNVGGGSDTAANVTALTDYLPLLAEKEVFGTRTYANSTEQTYQAQYKYYIDGGAKVKYQSSSQGSAARWWLRSPYSSDSYYFCFVNTNGDAASNYAYYSYGCAPLLVV